MDDRYELNAAIERLVEPDTEVFLTEDAAILIAKTPHTKKSRFMLSVIDSTGGKGTEGYAAGHGNVQIEGDKKSKTKTFGAPEVARVGGYKLRHRAGRVLINLMWEDLNEANHRDNDRVLLRYDPLTKAPMGLFLSRYRTTSIRLWPFSIEFNFVTASWAKWKRPV
jgi:hypothetical protein